MIYGLILAGGVGQRMRSSGMPKQFLEVFGKPIIIYTLEKFEQCKDIDQIIIACNAAWIDYLKELLQRYNLKKVKDIILGGKDRQESVLNGIRCIQNYQAADEDIIVIHDGVRPLIQEQIIYENIRIAEKFGCAMTVRPAIESVIITENDTAGFSDFKNRECTYSLTSPQTFKLKILADSYDKINNEKASMPLLDAALVVSYLGNDIHIIKENNHNIKITTPEDYYILKAMLELQENRYVFGI